MSRPAAAVHRVIKAYDVRGLVGEELDEQFVADVGGAFARLVRERAGASPGGDRLRHAGELAVAGGRVRRGRDGAGARRGADRAGLDRSAVLRVGTAGLSRRDVHRQPQSGRLQRHQAVPRRRQARRQGHRAHRDQRRGHRRCARVRRAARHDHRPRRAGRLRRVSAVTGRLWPSCVRCGSPSTPATAWAATPHPRCSGAIPSITLLPLYFELDGTFPNHEANPLDPANLVDLQALRRGDRRRHRAGLRRRRRPVFRRRRTGASGVAVGGDRAGRRAGTEPRDRRNGDPQPDHLPRGARTGRRARVARRCARASATPTSRR